MTAELQHVDVVDGDLLAGLRNGAWLDQQVFPPLRFAVPNIIPEGFSLLVGPPKVGKSWFVLAAAIAIAHGGRVLGNIPVEPRPVLYLALEDGHRRLQDRCRTLLEGDPIPAAMDYLTVVEPGHVLATIRAWLDRHSGSEPFVVLDTLGKVMPAALMGESAYQRDYRIGGALKRAADEHVGASVLVNHHDRKAAADDFVDAVSGTHGLAGSADTIVVLCRARNENTGLIKVTGRDVPEGEYALTFDAGARWLLDGSTFHEASRRAATARATGGLGDRSAAIVGYVANTTTPVTAADIADRYDIDQDTAGKYLRRLAEAERLVRVGRGRYAAPPDPLSEVSEVSETPDRNGQTDTTDTPLWGDE